MSIQQTYIEITRNKYRRYREIHGMEIETVYSFLEQFAIDGFLWRLIEMDDLSKGEKSIIDQLFVQYKEHQVFETKEEQRRLEKLLGKV